MDITSKISAKAVLFDLEGVLVHGKKYQVLPGAREILEYLSANEVQFKVVTNNTTETPESLLEILSDREVFLKPSTLQTPLSLLKLALSPRMRCYVLGSEKLKSFISKYGGEIVQDAQAETVICGGGYRAESASLGTALEALVKFNARLLTLHRNKLFTDENGKHQMCVGAVAAALEFSSGVTATNLGKPSREYYQAATSHFNQPNENILLVSDDPYSDLEGAKQQGLKTAFILTGKYQADIVSTLSFSPDFIVSNLTELQERLVFDNL